MKLIEWKQLSMLITLCVRKKIECESKNVRTKSDNSEEYRINAGNLLRVKLNVKIKKFGW